MPYYSGKRQRIGGCDYQAGEVIPSSVINRMKSSVLNHMLGSGRLSFSDKEPERVARPKLLETKPGGWYIFENGIKVHGKRNLEKFMSGA